MYSYPSRFLHWRYIADMLLKTFQWIPPLYIKAISCISEASVVCSVTTAPHIDLYEEIICVLRIYWLKSKWILVFSWKIHKELKCLSSFCVNHFLRYCLMMQHQRIVERVNWAMEWAHKACQFLSAPYHRHLFEHRRQNERQPPQPGWPVPVCI